MSSHNQDPEDVIVGGKKGKSDRSARMPWEEDFGPVNFSDIDRILSSPGIEDFGGILARANFSSDEVRRAFLVTIFNMQSIGESEKGTNGENGMKNELEFMRVCAQSTLGNKGFGKTLQLQSKVEVVVPTVIREQLSLTKIKGKEQAVKKSDFSEKETEMKHGVDK